MKELIAPIPAATQFADLGTHRLAYAEVGSGPQVLFLHGGLMDGQSWGNQLPLADRFRLILPDTRGHGQSGGADLPATYAGFAEDALALMDHLGIDRAAVVGFSDGGCAALHMALVQPERISHLVLIGTPYDLGAYHDGIVDHFGRMRPEDMEAVRPMVAELIGKMRRHLTEAEWRAYWTRIVHGLWVREPNFRLDDFASLPMPVLIMQGEHERSVRLEAIRDLAATIPDCQLEIIPGATHSAAQDAPIAVNRHLAQFLI